MKAVFQATHGVRLEERDAPWTAREIQALDQVLSLLPREFVSQNQNLKSIVRQAKYTGDYAGAPGHGMYQESAGPRAKKDYLVLYDRAFYRPDGQVDPGLVAQTVVHEVAHSLDEEQPGPYQEWLELSRWFVQDGQWLPARDRGFVSAYAREHPKEDYAESFTTYVLDPDRLRRVSPAKFQFMDRLFRR